MGDRAAGCGCGNPGMAERRTVVRMALGYAMRRVDGSDDGIARGW